MTTANRAFLNAVLDVMDVRPYQPIWVTIVGFRFDSPDYTRKEFPVTRKVLPWLGFIDGEAVWQRDRQISFELKRPSWTHRRGARGALYSVAFAVSGSPCGKTSPLARDFRMRLGDTLTLVTDVKLTVSMT